MTSVVAAPTQRVEPSPSPRHRARRLHIDTGQEAVVYLHHDSEVCRSEGFQSETRIWVRIGDQAILATLNVFTGDLLAHDEAGLSETAWAQLGAADGQAVELAHALPLESLRHVRGKIHGRRLDAAALTAIVRDVAAGYYSDIHLASFITACGGERLDRQELIDLTTAALRPLGLGRSHSTTPSNRSGCCPSLASGRLKADR
jgi:thymidine phosphorylase